MDLYIKARLHDATKTCDHAMCIKIALCKQAYCDMRLPQESWMISTFLRQHATVACRTNKPVYTAQFCRMSHITSVLSHRVNAPLGCGGFEKNGTENRHEKNDITDLPLRDVIINACDTLMTYTTLFKDGSCKHKRRENIPWNKTNSGMLPWFDPTSEYPIHSSERSDVALLALNREFKNVLRLL